MTEAISFHNVFPLISDPLFPYLDIDTLGKLPLVNHAFNTHLKNKTLFQHVQTAARSIYQLNNLQCRQCVTINKICDIQNTSQDLSSDFAITEIQLTQTVLTIETTLRSLIKLEQIQRCLSLLTRVLDRTTNHINGGLVAKERIEWQFKNHPISIIEDAPYSPSLLYRHIPSLSIVAAKQFAKMLFANRNFESLNALLERCSGCPQFVRFNYFIPRKFANSCFKKLYFNDHQKHSRQEVVHAYMNDPDRQGNLEQPPPIVPQWILTEIIDYYSFEIKKLSLNNAQMWEQIGTVEDVISQLCALDPCYVKNPQRWESEFHNNRVLFASSILFIAKAFSRRALPEAALKCLDVGFKILDPMIGRAETVLATQTTADVLHNARTIKSRHKEYTDLIRLLRIQTSANVGCKLSPIDSQLTETF